MSISNNNNADNHNSLLRMPPHQSPVEENKKWRCTKLSKGGNDLLTLSPEYIEIPGVGIGRRMNGNEEMNPKPCTTKISPTHPRVYRSFHVRLAEESPKRNCAEHSDSSTYGSMNCYETDICQDSSDTDSSSSSSSDPIGIKVVEYEVASTSNSEDLFTNDSSSGTSDVFIAFASVLCDSARLSSNFADTEKGSSDTGSMYDSEISLADYWKCVKCKNKNNNPMFRYCEKCYQIRKNHFPRRPRLRKSRSALKQRKLIGLSSLQRAATTSLIEESLQRGRDDKSEKVKLHHTSSSPSSPFLQKEPFIGRRVGISQKQLRNSVESSTDDEETTSKFYKFMNNTSSENYIKGTTDSGSHFSSSSMVTKCNVQNSPQNLQMCTKRKLSTDSQSANKSISKKICYNKDLISNLSASETENETDFALSQTLCGSSTQSTQKDSGFSSAPSSQERKSSSEPNDEYEDFTSHPNIRDDVSDTVSDELNDSDVDEIILQDKFTHNNDDTCRRPVENSTKGISDSLHPPILNKDTALPLLQTISDCSDTYSSIASPSNQDSLKISPAKQAAKLDRNFGDITSYGSCMTCLTEPKNGVFVHSRFLHLCCCYKCAVKIWNKNKKCPICNCAVKNVMKLFVH